MWIFKRSLFIPIIFDLVDPLIRCMFFRQDMGGFFTLVGSRERQETTYGKQITKEEITKVEPTPSPRRLEGAVKIDKFPTDMHDDMPYIVFTSASGDTLGKATIGLPMPSNLLFQDQAQYGSTEASAAEILSKGGANGALDFSALANAAKGFGKDLLKKAAQTVGGGATTAIMRQNGVAFNPNIITEFNSMSTRRFSFQYKFMPRSENDSDTIRNIQYAFQARAYPTIKEKALILKYPPKWTIHFKGADLPGIRDCYLESVGFTVNPSSNRWHYHGNASEVDLSLSFIETKALTAEDIVGQQFGSSATNPPPADVAAALGFRNAGTAVEDLPKP